jgi:replicative DNA helicase
MSFFNDYVGKDMEKGMRGENTGIPIPLSRISKVINNIQQGLYTLVGAQSGVGKSAFVTMVYVLFPYLWSISGQRKEKLKVVFFSMERGKKFQVQKLVCAWLYLKHGILIDVPTLNQWEGKLFDIGSETEKMIRSAEDFVEDLIASGIVEIIAGQQNPTGIYKYIENYVRTVGKVEKIIHYKDPSNPSLGSTHTESIYTPNDANLTTVMIIDHIGRLRLEKNYTKKQNADKLSEYLANARDEYKISPVVVSQFNRGQSDSIRRHHLGAAFPEPNDFKDSSNMYEDCDIAMGLYNAYKYDKKKEALCLDYKINEFTTPRGYNRFRTLHVLKNSFGRDDVNIALNFIGECGMFAELPYPDQLPLKYDPFLDGSYTRNQVEERMREKGVKLEP